ncbi:hypothetical protein CALVIDRAFT_554132 [Calocera viscosa TUFC12733]|uniref:DNA replication regulator Sld3 C-terminal domain-containing protein n=1 Tax=Calocera viscosa (strain TUFC12733) TaxID=1330018 RepID=A0A167NTL6_CALVF|nr:hypothetical protein CALVIDRAFT_554132 [Calocera viscosa TUFC12733]
MTAPPPFPALDLSCPLAWPAAHSSDYPLRTTPSDTPAQTVHRVYLETLWLPEVLAQALRGVCVDLDGIERKFRVILPGLLGVEGAEGTGGGEVGEGAQTEVALMRFVWRVRCRNREKGERMREGEGDGEEDGEDKEDRERAVWFDELERREVQIQALIRLLLVTLPPLPPAPSPKKRKRERHAAPAPPTPEEEFDSLTDRLCIWHALGSVVEEVRLPGSEEERGWVRVWQEDVLAPLFERTLAAPLVQAFHEKLDPTLSPPSSPAPSPPGSPSLPAFAGLPTLSNSLETASMSSRSASLSSVSFGAPGYRRSMSVSSAGGSTRSVSVTRTGVNNSRNWAGKEVRMGKRAIGGARPRGRQASLPAAPPPQPAPRPFKRAETQTLVMSTPVKKSGLPNRVAPSSTDEVMETPQKGG